MCADDAAELLAAEPVNLSFPEIAALGDILTEHLVGSAGVAQQDRLCVIDAVEIDLLDQEIVGLAGSPGFSEKNDIAVFDGHNGFNVEDTSRESSCLGDPSSLFKILQRVKTGQQADIVSLADQMLCQLVQSHSLLDALLRVLGKDAGPDRYVAAVDDPYIGEVLCRDQGALEGAGQPGGDCDHDGLIAFVAQLPVDPGESVGWSLAGLGEHIAGLQHPVKILLAEIDTVTVILLPERDRERHDGKLICIRRVGVNRRVCNDSNGHIYLHLKAQSALFFRKLFVDLSTFANHSAI